MSWSSSGWVAANGSGRESTSSTEWSAGSVGWDNRTSGPWYESWDAIPFHPGNGQSWDWGNSSTAPAVAGAGSWSSSATALAAWCQAHHDQYENQGVAESSVPAIAESSVPAIVALEAGRQTEAEGYVHENHMARGYKLEEDAMNSKASFHQALASREEASREEEEEEDANSDRAEEDADSDRVSFYDKRLLGKKRAAAQHSNSLPLPATTAPAVAGAGAGAGTGFSDPPQNEAAIPKGLVRERVQQITKPPVSQPPTNPPVINEVLTSMRRAIRSHDDDTVPAVADTVRMDESVREEVNSTEGHAFDAGVLHNLGVMEYRGGRTQIVQCADSCLHDRFAAIHAMLPEALQRMDEPPVCFISAPSEALPDLPPSPIIPMKAPPIPHVQAKVFAIPWRGASPPPPPHPPPQTVPPMKAKPPPPPCPPETAHLPPEPYIRIGPNQWSWVGDNEESRRLSGQRPIEDPETEHPAKAPPPLIYPKQFPPRSARPQAKGPPTHHASPGSALPVGPPPGRAPPGSAIPKRSPPIFSSYVRITCRSHTTRLSRQRVP